MRFARFVAVCGLSALAAACGNAGTDAGSGSARAASAPGGERGKPTAADGAGPAAAGGACGNLAPGAECSERGASAAATAGWAEGRLIVKFKDRLREPADVVHAHGRRFADDARSGGRELDALAARWRVRAVAPAFPSWFDGVPAVPGRGALAARRQRVHEAVSRSRAAFPARSRRAPAGAQVPDLANVYVLEVPAGTDVRRMARDYAANENVAYAVPDRLAQASMVPNDPYFFTAGSWGQGHADLWALTRIGAPAAWDSASGLGVVVAVVDTGLDLSHPDISANAWTNLAEASGRPGVDDDANGYVDDARGWNFTYLGSADVTDRHGHGTHVSGTVAAIGNNGLGVIGVAHEAKIMPLKALDDYGQGAFSGLANAITYAARNGADVVNDSWGCYGAGCESAIIADAIALARSVGCVVTFAAGNDGGDVRYASPASLPEVITVASTGVDDRKSSFSNSGWLVDLAAPGGGPGDTTSQRYNILSLKAAAASSSYTVGTQYLRLGGTSMATPHVSAVAALLLSENPALTIAEVEAILERTAADEVGDPALDVPGFDPHHGWGRLDAAAALARAFDPPVHPPLLKAIAGPLDFTLPRSSCGQPWALPVDVHNVGGGTLDWTASAPDWLTVTPASAPNGAALAAAVGELATRGGTVAIAALDGSVVELPVSERVLSSVSVAACEVVLSRAAAEQQWGPHYSTFNDSPPAVADGAGGAIYVWNDFRIGGHSQIFAQRVDGLGRPLWADHGVQLSTTSMYSQAPAIVSDGAGGAIVAWVEGTDFGSSSGHIRVQRVDASGQGLWGTLFVSQGANGDTEPSIASDGAGGAIVSWIRFGGTYGYDQSDVYAQRVDASGAQRWQAGGAPVTRATGGQQNLVTAPDGAGGAFFAWEDLRGGIGAWFVYGQHLGPAGNPLWAADGIAITPVDVQGPSVVPDGAGGAIFAWRDYRAQAAAWWRIGDIYAMRVDAAGRSLWRTGGAPVVTGLSASSARYVPPFVPATVTTAQDGQGGLLVTWMDHRNGKDLDVYAQRLDPSGNRLWGDAGTPVTAASNGQISPAILADGRGGAIFAWTDFRAGNGDIFVQRLAPSGAPLLGADGVWIDSRSGGVGIPALDPPFDSGDQYFPYLQPLADHRVLVTWDDHTSGASGVDVAGKVIEFASDVAVAPAGATVAPGGAVAFAASGGSEGGWTWSLATNASGGVIEPGTGAYVAGPAWSVTDVVRVEDAFGNLATAEVAVVAAAAIAPETAAVPPRGRVEFAASGASGAGWEWSLRTNASGGAIDAATGAYVAGPNGGVTDVVQVRDAWGIVAAREVTVTAGVSLAAPPATPPLGTLALAASGGSGAPWEWSFVANPSGGTLDAATGAYRAGATGAVVDEVRVTDGLGNEATARITVTEGVSITPSVSTLAPGAERWLEAEGGGGAPYAWSLVTNASGGSVVPAGSTLGVYVAGRTGDVTDVVEVADGLGNTSRASLAVTAALSIAPSAPAVAPLGTLDLEAVGGSGADHLWLFSAGESGGTLDPLTGVYRAGPRGGSVDVVWVIDSLGNRASTSVTIGAGITIDPGTATVQAGGAETFTASGGSGSGYAWTLATNASGGTIDAATGAYAAGPTGGVTDVVRATDTLGNVGAAAVEVTPLPPPEEGGGCGCGSGGAGGASLVLAALAALAPRRGRRRDGAA